MSRERSRTDDLLIEAARAFADGSSPFEPGWLSDHSVTFDECLALSGAVAMACWVFAEMGPQARALAALMVRSDDAADRRHLLGVAMQEWALREAGR